MISHRLSGGLCWRRERAADAAAVVLYIYTNFIEQIHTHTQTFSTQRPTTRARFQRRDTKLWKYAHRTESEERTRRRLISNWTRSRRRFRPSPRCSSSSRMAAARRCVVDAKHGKTRDARCEENLHPHTNTSKFTFTRWMRTCVQYDDTGACVLCTSECMCSLRATGVHCKKNGTLLRTCDSGCALRNVPITYGGGMNNRKSSISVISETHAGLL